ncbi:hypothetical protein CDAR_85101 [Caerostris darwini]|uniref:Uncharacterized protein n=1 Tax=Caerostris darwini TaxID=1538125 RepID=A0AAV4MZ90_9ARAC|nr:hypothetical protein CDAR_85101 [Caerostris darwini]
MRSINPNSKNVAYHSLEEGIRWGGTEIGGLVQKMGSGTEDEGGGGIVTEKGRKDKVGANRVHHSNHEYRDEGFIKIISWLVAWETDCHCSENTPKSDESKINE